VDWRRVLVFGCGVALIVLGFLGWHVNVAAVVVGLILLGGLSGDLLMKWVGSVRNVGSAGPEASSPPADPAREDTP
jgi:hypothetical protein